MLSYGYHSDIDHYIGQISLRHRIIDIVSTEELHSICIDPAWAAISALHQNAYMKMISKGRIYLGFADVEVRCVSNVEWLMRQ